jgi:hypothetical protein
MKFTDITNANELWQFMTTPSDGLVASMKALGSDDMMILGGSGKMGKELVGLVQQADRLNGVQRKIMVASTFSQQEDLNQLMEMGVVCFQGDLAEESFLDSLPDAPYVVYMMGFKFGSSGNWTRAFHMNAIVPYLVGRKYRNASILVFSSGNPYPHTDRYGPGASEKDALQPMGIYGWTIVARESSFRTTAMQHAGQQISIYRLMYAQHLQYGVLVDLARMIVNREPISLAMPAVNLISQRDANEVALKSFNQCNKEGWLVNAAGPVWQVRDIVTALAEHLGKEAIFEGSESDQALLADDSKARQAFGEYRDSCPQMIQAAAQWVGRGGAYWNKPTLFGRVRHNY